MARKRKHFTVDVSTATQVVAGIASTKLRLFNFFIETDVEADKASLTVAFQDDETTAVALTPTISFALGKGPIASHKMLGGNAWWGETTSGADLDVKLSAAKPCRGWVEYEEVAA